MKMEKKIHFLQSNEWAYFQRARGNHTFIKSGTGWHYLAIIEHSKLADRLYCPYGPYAKNTTALSSALKDLKKEAQTRHLAYIRIEPLTPLSLQKQAAWGMYKAHKNIQPQHTILTDVSGSEDTIIAATSQTVRRLWRKNIQAGITYQTSYQPEDIADFLAMLRSVSVRTEMLPHSDVYFRTMATHLFPRHSAGLLFATLENKRVASILFFKDSTTMYYAHAASYNEYRKRSPATSLALYALLFAHEQGCSTFDFFGAAPPEAPESHPWKGFSQFKLSFGGKLVASGGTLEMPINSLRYKLYRQALGLYKWTRR